MASLNSLLGFNILSLLDKSNHEIVVGSQIRSGVFRKRANVHDEACLRLARGAWRRQARRRATAAIPLFIRLLCHPAEAGLLARTDYLVPLALFHPRVLHVHRPGSLFARAIPISENQLCCLGITHVQ
jgi:hypothetical protein